jgi:hypothetical protein
MSRSFGGAFFARWVTAVTLSLALAAGLAFAFVWSLGEAVERAAGETAAIFVVGGLFGAAIGGGVGLGQAMVLRTLGIRPGRWLVQTLIAGAIGMAIGFTLVFIFTDSEEMPEVVAGTLMGVSLGLPIGLVQWRMLKQHVAQAQLWLAICLVVFTVGFVIGLPLGGEGRELLSVAAVGLLTALISGAGIVWLGQSRETAAAL